MKEFKIIDKVNQHSLIGVTMDTPIEVEIVKTVNPKTSKTRCIAYQIKDGLIVAEGPELEKYIPLRGNGVGWIKPDYRYLGDKRDYVLECDDLDGYTGSHVACIWHWYEPVVRDDIALDHNDYFSRPLAFDGDVYEFFHRNIEMMELSSVSPYQLIARKCVRFMEDNPKASIHQKSEFIRGLLNKYYRAVRDGHINCQDADIFFQIDLYLRFDAERKAHNKAKRTAQKRANKVARREAREVAKLR